MVGDGVALGMVAWRRGSHDGGDDVDEGGVGGDGCGGVMALWRWWRQVGGGCDGVALGMVGDGVALGMVAWSRASHDGCGGVMDPVHQ
ncbi:hypothetical protein Tco_0780507 [Tanacetum coccineum]